MGFFGNLFARKLDTASAEELADILISGDISPNIADEIVHSIKKSDNPKGAMRKILLDYARKLEGIPPNPKTVLIVGVNGAGKTTTVGKLANQFRNSGKSVIIGACDTFRAAANEQLDIWASRANAKIIHGTEPAATAYNTIESASADDIVLLDTAGRLHNRTDLMDELAKIVRVVKKLDESAPTDIWLTLDGTAGQNALNQIEFFNKVVKLTGLVVTKMDGTSKGGFLISYAASMKNPLPVVYIGYGEKIADLKPFNAEEYVAKFE